MKSKGFSLRLPLALGKDTLKQGGTGLPTGEDSGVERGGEALEETDRWSDEEALEGSIQSVECLNSPQSSSLFLARTQMQLEDLLSNELRRTDIDWQDEGHFDIPESPVLREDEIPSSPATSPPKLKRMGYLLQSQVKEPEHMHDTWNCTYPDLISLQLSLSSLIDSCRCGSPSSTLLSFGPVSLTVNVAPHSTEILSKGTIAGWVSKSIGKKEGKDRWNSQKSNAYVKQLENELLQAEIANSSPISLNCPHDPLETDWQTRLDEAISRISLQNYSKNTEKSTHNRVKSAFVEVNRLKSASKTHFSSLNSAITDLKQAENDYKSLTSSLTKEMTDLRTQILTLQRENQKYTEKWSIFTSKIAETVKTANQTPLICPIFPQNQSNFPDFPQIQAQIAHLEAELTEAAPWQRPKIDVKLSLLRNKLLQMTSNAAISINRENSAKIAEKTAVLDSFLALNSKNKRKSTLSVCNTPRKNESFAFLTKKDASFRLDFDRLDRTGLETDRSTVENDGRLAMTSRNKEIDGVLAGNRRKMREISEFEAEITAEKAKLDVFSDVLRKKERELAEKEELILQNEQNSLKNSSQAQILTIFHEKYSKLVKIYQKKDKKATEDLLRLREFEEQLIKREMQQNSAKEELKSLISTADFRISLLETAKNDVISLCRALQL